MAQRLVSPQEMFDAGCSIMLEGRKPESREDWMLLVNFFAVNIAREVQPVATRVVALIMGCPLSESEINWIVEQQLACGQAHQ